MALALAGRVEQITCVDTDANAIGFLRRELSARGLSNVQAVQGDGERLAGRWDTVLLMNYRRWDDRLPHYLSLCGRNLIAISRVNCESNAGLSHRYPMREGTARAIHARLTAMNARYTYREATLEYGQPFADRAQAAAFVREYAAELAESDVQPFLEKRLRQTGNERWPLYLPNEKRMGIFIIPALGGEDGEA
mgnify:CR=1 FL=1